MNRINSKRGKKTIEGHTCWYSLIIIFKSSHVLAKPPLKRSIQDNISQCDNDKTNIEMLFQNLPTALNWQLKYARKSLQIKVTHNSLPIKCVAAFSWAISCNSHNLMWSREQFIRTNVNKIPEYCTATRNAEQAHTHIRDMRKRQQHSKQNGNDRDGNRPDDLNVYFIFVVVMVNMIKKRDTLTIYIKLTRSLWIELSPLFE